MMVIALQISGAAGTWPVVAVCGMALHGLLLISLLERERRRHRNTRIDGLMALALSFILWFAITPLFSFRGDQARPAAPTADRHPERPSITGDLVAVNQAGDTVRLSGLRGKVWAVAEFFAVCPLCARRNATDLKALAERFAAHPDFHLVCISIDPEQDDVERLAGYAEALGADARNWWFLTGEPAVVHRYLEEDLKFPPVRERTGPDEIAALGRYLHDMGIMVVDRRMRIVGKRDLAWAASQSAELKDQWERHLHGIIQNELDRTARAP